MSAKMKLVCLIAALGIHVAVAQDCNQNLDESRRAFYDGQFDRVLELLEPCVSKLSSLPKRSEALALLSKASLMLNHTEQAEKYVVTLLSTNPLFVAANSELISFKALLDQYEIRTRYNYGFEVGVNQSDYTIMQYQSLASNSIEPKSYEAKTGINVGLSFEYALTRNVYARAKLLYQNHQYTQRELLLDYQTLTVSERLNYVALPLQLKYEFDRWKIRPFVSGGISIHRLIKSNASLDLKGIDPGFPVGVNPNSYSTSSYDLSDQRKSFTMNYAVGIGARKTYGLYSIQAEAQYELGLNNLAKADARYNDPVLLTTYEYVSDDFKMDHIRFTIGITKSVFYPKKRSE